MQSTPLLPSLPSPLWPGVVAPDKGPIYGLNRTKPCFLHNTDFMLNWIIWKITVLTFNSVYCPVGWGCRIHRLHHCRGVMPSNECRGYDTKQSDGEVPVMLGLWGKRSIPSLPLFPGQLWPCAIASDRALSMG